MKSLALSALLALGGAFPATAACPAVTGIVDAFNKGDEQGARTIARSPETASCTADEKTLIGRVAALTAFNRIATAVGNGGNLADHQATLEELQKEFGGPWQIFDALGDLARERRDFEPAARFYQLALEDSSNETLTPQWMAPDEDYIRRLDRLANEMRLAAPKPVQLAMRGGCKISFRGVKIKKKSTPVRYVFGTADFTPEGVEAAKDLTECLKTVKPTGITLIGHTDPVGSSEANLRLSLARAETLAAYLSENGFVGHIETVGRGEDEPFQPDDASAYDEETLFQLHRRVEVDVQE
ncbi:OmpA family protein [Rhizobium sp. TRM95111]|uniref:OmpA family protein n=1 Tax=Rhizobium alarense TaxID=2846851 RepID=UPI001F4614C4|nr:OmpA family protein [Rhizobium alarense]MCF3641119.1 OmpA family protein [Rhizobium alarense]